MIDGQTAATYGIVAIAAGFVARSVWKQVSGAVHAGKDGAAGCGGACGCSSDKIPDLPPHIAAARKGQTLPIANSRDENAIGK